MAATARQVEGKRPHVYIDYSPRAVFVPWHERTQRWSIEVAHRRCGKTVARINELIKRAIQCPLDEPHFAYVAPTFAQAKDVTWNYLKRFTQPLPMVEANEAELRIDIPRAKDSARLRLYGAENYDRMRGIYLDGVVLDEFGMIDPRAWPEVIRPALSDRKGWADFIGTPSGMNHFSDMYDVAGKDPNWYRAIHRASETGLLDAAELADARKAMTEEQYQQEYECSFQASVVGAYYGREMSYLDSEKRIGRVPWEPALQVHTAWDLGRGDNMAIWFAQFVGNEVRIIDFLQGTGVGLPSYVAQLRERPYVYGEHILPHDVGVTELGTETTRLATLRSLGMNNVRVLPNLPGAVREGINATRNLLPRCWIDAVKCEHGIKALRQYRREYDDARKIFHDMPFKDWTNHAADSFRYMAMGQPKDRKAPKLIYSNKGIV